VLSEREDYFASNVGTSTSTLGLTTTCFPLLPWVVESNLETMMGGGPRPLLYPAKITIELGLLFRVKVSVQSFVSYTYTTLRTNSPIDCPISG
jgi:hypothetical protein